MSDGSPIPGWYADPQDPARLRWWDGTQWTSHTQPYPLEAGGAAGGPDSAAGGSFGGAAATGGVAGAAGAMGASQFGGGGATAAAPGQFGGGISQPGGASQQPSPFAVGQPGNPQPGQYGGQPPEASMAANEWGNAGPAGFGVDPGMQPGAQGGFDPYGQPGAGQPATSAPGFGAQPGYPGAAGFGQQDFGQPGYGNAQAGYGGAQPGYGGAQQGYGGAQPGYGAAQQGYGGAQSGYGTQQGYGYGYDQPGGYAPIDTGDTSERNKMIIAGLVGALAASLLGGLLWLLFGRDSGSTSGVSNTTSSSPFPTDSFTQGSSTANSAACASLVDAMTANNQPTEVSVRLQELASNVNASDNAQYFTTLESDLAPARDSYQQDCLADIASGRESSTYRSFVTSFDRAVSDGATLGQQIASTNTVDPAQARTLTDNATQLEQATASLPVTSSSSTGAPSIPGLTDQGLSAASPLATPSSTFPSASVITPTPSASVVDPFATPVVPQAVTPTPVVPVTPVPVTPTPVVPTPTPDSALAQQQNAADEAARRSQSAATK